MGHTDNELSTVFAELAELAELGDVASIPVAIERGEGLVVGLIAGAGHPVLMVEVALGQRCGLPGLVAGTLTLKAAWW